MSPTPVTLTNTRTVTPEGTHEGWVHVDGGRITALGTGEPPRGAVHDAAGRWVAPGLVDTHVHGGAGHGFPEADPEGARKTIAYNRTQGVTSMVGGLVAASPEDTLRQVSVLADLCDEGELAGIYLRPFIARQRVRRTTPSCCAIRTPPSSTGGWRRGAGTSA